MKDEYMFFIGKEMSSDVLRNNLCCLIRESMDSGLIKEGEPLSKMLVDLTEFDNKYGDEK